MVCLSVIRARVSGERLAFWRALLGCVMDFGYDVGFDSWERVM